MDSSVALYTGPFGSIVKLFPVLGFLLPSYNLNPLFGVLPVERFGHAQTVLSRNYWEGVENGENS